MLNIIGVYNDNGSNANLSQINKLIVHEMVVTSPDNVPTGKVSLQYLDQELPEDRYISNLVFNADFSQYLNQFKIVSTLNNFVVKLTNLTKETTLLGTVTNIANNEVKITIATDDEKSFTTQQIEVDDELLVELDFIGELPIVAGTSSLSILDNLPEDGVIHIGLTGQSNASERALNSDAEASEIKDYPNFKVWVSGNVYQTYNPSTFGDASKHNILLHLAIWFENNKPDLIVYASNYAVGGTSIVNHLTGGSVYETYWNNHFLPSIQSLIASGKTVYPLLLFLQGEADSNNTADTFQYRENHNNWVKLWQDNVSVRLPIMCVEVIESDLNDQIINQVKTLEEKEQINVVKVSNKDAASNDNLHYNYAGLQTICNRVIEAINGFQIWHKQKENFLVGFAGSFDNELNENFQTYTAPTTDAAKFNDNIGNHQIVNILGSNRLGITGTANIGGGLLGNTSVQAVEYADLNNVTDFIFDFSVICETSFARGGIFFRTSPSTSAMSGYILLFYSGTNIRVYKNTNGSISQLASGGCSVSAGVQSDFRITAFGSQISIYENINGSYQLAITLTDNSFSSGVIGHCSNFASTGEDFYIDNIKALYNTN